MVNMVAILKSDFTLFFQINVFYIKTYLKKRSHSLKVKCCKTYNFLHSCSISRNVKFIPHSSLVFIKTSAEKLVSS